MVTGKLAASPAWPPPVTVSGSLMLLSVKVSTPPANLILMAFVAVSSQVAVLEPVTDQPAEIAAPVSAMLLPPVPTVPLTSPVVVKFRLDVASVLTKVEKPTVNVTDVALVGFEAVEVIEVTLGCTLLGAKVMPR